MPESKLSETHEAQGSHPGPVRRGGLLDQAQEGLRAIAHAGRHRIVGRYRASAAMRSGYAAVVMAASDTLRNKLAVLASWIAAERSSQPVECVAAAEGVLALGDAVLRAQHEYLTATCDIEAENAFRRGFAPMAEIEAQSDALLAAFGHAGVVVPPPALRP